MRLDVKADPRFTVATTITLPDGTTFTSRRRREFTLRTRKGDRIPVEIVDGWVTSEGEEFLIPRALVAGHCWFCPDTTRYRNLRLIALEAPCIPS